MDLDRTLVTKALAGDALAFQAVVEATWGLVFVHIQQRLADREQSKDLTQDTFLQAFAKRETLKNAGSFIPWVLTIASNKVIDYHRRRGVRPEILIGEKSSLEQAANTANSTRQESSLENPNEQAENEELIRSSLHQIPDNYRTVLILKYFSSLSPAQIARLLNEPEGTIRNRIFRAHVKLRRVVEGQNATCATDTGKSAQKHAPKKRGEKNEPISE